MILYSFSYNNIVLLYTHTIMYLCRLTVDDKNAECNIAIGCNVY